MEGSEQRLCVVSPSFAKDKTSCIVLETRQQRAAVIPKERKMKPASSSYQQMACGGGGGGGGGGYAILHNCRKTDRHRRLTCCPWSDCRQNIPLGF